jgi:hypothetical protein
MWPVMAAMATAASIAATMMSMFGITPFPIPA